MALKRRPVLAESPFDGPANEATNLRQFENWQPWGTVLFDCRDCHNFDRPAMGKCSQHPQLSGAGTVFGQFTLSAWQ